MLKHKQTFYLTWISVLLIKYKLSFDWTFDDESILLLIKYKTIFPLKAVFHKIYLVHSGIICPKYWMDYS